jgi:tetratricopeptide (TPR) repeat protein
MRKRKRIRDIPALLFGGAVFFILCVSAFLMPLFYLPFAQDQINAPKEIIFFGLTGLALFLWSIRTVSYKKVLWRKTIIDIPFLLFGLFILVSAVFSQSFDTSVFGRGDGFVLHAVFVALLLVYAWLIIQEVYSATRWYVLLMSGLAGVFFSGLVFLLASVGAFDIISLLSIRSIDANLFSHSPTVFGIAMSASAAIGLGLMIQRGARQWLVFFGPLVAIVGIAVIAVIGFSVHLLLLAIGCALLLLFGAATLYRSRMVYMSVIWFVLLCSVFFAWRGVPASITKQVTIEVSLSSAVSTRIVGSAFIENAKTFLLGTGPGTFAFSFSAHRPQEFTQSASLSSIRFHRPHNTFLAVLSESGLLAAVSLLTIFLFGLGATVMSVHGLYHQKKRVKYSHTYLGKNEFRKDRHAFDSLAVATGWLVVSVGMGVVFYDAAMMWLWFWLLGLTLAGFATLTPDLVEERFIQVRLSAQRQLVASFVSVTVLVLFLISTTTMIRWYVAEIAFSDAQAAATRTDHIRAISRAASLRPGYAPYHISLSQAYLERARHQSSQDDVNADDVARDIVFATNEAKIASELDPKNVAGWEALTIMYMNARAFADDANEWAKDAIEQSISLEPNNPSFYWRLGSIYQFDGTFKEAEDAYRQSIRLNPQYIASYLSLADMYEVMEDIDSAVAVYDALLSADSSQLDAMYHKGRVLFNRGGREDVQQAKEVWEELIAVDSEYSNALYSLGLLHDQRGQQAVALEYFRQVELLNPDNEDVKAKIRSLL